MTQEFFYRVEESRYTEENGHKDIFIHAYPVIRETPKGAWLNLSKWEDECPPPKARRFVLRDNGKFAQPTPELAIAAFRKRKTIHIRMMKWRLEVIQRTWEIAQTGHFQPCNIERVKELVGQHNAGEVSHDETHSLQSD